MANLIKVEFFKFKRKKIFYYFLLLTLIFPLLGAIIMTKSGNINFSDLVGFIREESSFILLMPILVILAINSFFMEHDYDTIKNLLVIPINKRDLILAKLIVLLMFSIVFQILGFCIAIFIAFIYQITIVNLALNLALSFAMGLLLWGASLPCIVTVVVLNKGYLLSIITVFIYTLSNYLMHFSESILMKPIGLNLGTVMPIPLIFRWLYQYYTPVGKIQIEFYSRFSEYFITTPVCFGILIIEIVISIVLILRFYEKREV